jgi:ribosomal protein L16 Arg81 hydroxylase
MTSKLTQSIIECGSAFQAIASSRCELGLGSRIDDEDTPQKRSKNNNLVQAFFRYIWQTQPAIFRSCRDSCVDKECPLFKAICMDWDDIAQLLHHCVESSSYAPLFFQDGNPVTDPGTSYANNPHAAYLDGCSIIVNHADCHHQIIANLCNNLQETFPHVYANSYLSPPDSHAVNAHADDRDVLVVQVCGSKKWKVYKRVPIEYPFENEQVGKNGLEVDSSVFAGGLCFGNKDLTLSEGDVLYLPRGFVHEASTHIQNAPTVTSEVVEPSFHITLAIATHDWCTATVLSEAIRKTLSGNPEFRKALPVGPCSEYGGSDLLKEELDCAMSFIQTSVTAKLLHEELTNKYSTHNSRARELRRNIATRKRPLVEEEDCVGYWAASRLALDSVVRVSSAEERNSVVLEEGRLRGLTVREETMQTLMTMVRVMKETPSLKIRVKNLRSITTPNETSCSINQMICDFTLLSFARCCVELGAWAIDEKNG